MKKAILVIQEHSGWMSDVALNYTQLNFDYSLLSRIDSADFDFYVADSFVAMDDYEYTIVLKAGTLLGYTYYENVIAPKVDGKYEFYYFPNNDSIFIWCPRGKGKTTFDIGYTLPYVNPESPDTFSATHDSAIQMLIDQSNISYIIHNEIPEPEPGAYGPIEWAMTVSSGFYINYVLDVCDFDTDAEIHHVDISKLSLRVRQYTIENWDGHNFYGWMDHLYEKFPLLDVYNGKHRYHSNHPAAIRCWEHVIETFGEEGWVEHWQCYQKLNHFYHNCNLGDHAKFKKILQDHSPREKYSAFWWDGALKRLPANLLKTSDQSMNMIETFLTILKNENPELIAYGSDHCGIEFNGITVTEALELLTNSRKYIWKMLY